MCDLRFLIPSGAFLVNKLVSHALVLSQRGGHVFGFFGSQTLPTTWSDVYTHLARSRPRCNPRLLASEVGQLFPAHTILSSSRLAGLWDGSPRWNQKTQIEHVNVTALWPSLL